MSNFYWATLYVHVSEVMQTERDAGPDFFRLICTNIMAVFGFAVTQSLELGYFDKIQRPCKRSKLPILCHIKSKLKCVSYAKKLTMPLHCQLSLPYATSN